MKTFDPKAGRLLADREGAGPPTYWKTLSRSGYAPVNGLQMYYEIHGNGSARPLITLPPVWALANVIPSLVGGRLQIAPELQAYGRTVDIDRAPSFEGHADDVAALMDYLEIEKADVFGESMGSLTALNLAIRHPGRVRRVAIWGNTGLTPDKELRPELQTELAGLSPNHSGVLFQRELYQRVAAEPAQWPHAFIRAVMVPWSGFTDEQLQSIKAPVLVAAGDRDGIPLERFIAFYRRIPTGQLAILPDTSHFILNEDPERLTSVVARFFDQPVSTLESFRPSVGYKPGVSH
jgi:pimeloyl-ACP methyl ester carboxylesterase